MAPINAQRRGDRSQTGVCTSDQALLECLDRRQSAHINLLCATLAGQRHTALRHLPESPDLFLAFGGL